jgi:hypothetical protein
MERLIQEIDNQDMLIGPPIQRDQPDGTKMLEIYYSLIGVLSRIIKSHLELSRGGDSVRTYVTRPVEGSVLLV